MRARPRRQTLDRNSADWGIMLRSLTALWGLGGASFILVLLTNHPQSPGAKTVLWCINIIGLAVLGLLVVARDRLPTWTPDLCAYLLYLVVGGVIFAFQKPDSPFAFFYLWLSVHAFYFLPWRRAAPQVVFIAVDYAVSLAAMPGSSFPYMRWAITVMTTAVICTLVALLKARVDALVTRLGEVARTDALTSLYNRRAYDEFVLVEIARADRTGKPLSLVIADLDHFKWVNDRFGHPTGDAVLRRVAAQLVKTGRLTDVAARLGGEEFAVLLPDTDTESALVVAERMRTAIRTTFRDNPLPVTMSFGIASYPDDGGDAETLFRAADGALLAAKAAGRDQAVVFSRGVKRVLPAPPSM